MLDQTTTIPDTNTTNNWQRYGESNPELVVESHSCYHYTISPLAGIARIELNFFRVKAECNKPLYDIPVLKNNIVEGVFNLCYNINNEHTYSHLYYSFLLQHNAIVTGSLAFQLIYILYSHT